MCDDDLQSRWLCISFDSASASALLRLEGTHLQEEVALPGFACDQATLLCALVANQFIVQVTSEVSAVTSKS